MPTCPQCEEQFEADQLVRHEHEGLVMVHCPGCQRVLGVYNRHHEEPPRTDRLRID